MSQLRAATAELDRAPATLLPVFDAAVEHGARVDAARCEHARSDPGSSARAADRYDGPVGESSGDRGQQPVGDVPRADDVAVIALVGLAHVEQDHSVLRDEPLELVEVDRLEPRVAAGRVDDETVEVDETDCVERSGGILCLSRGARVQCYAAVA